jgi:hypothetical protein
MIAIVVLRRAHALHEEKTMTPFTIVILICSMAVDHAACQPDTAVDVIQGPKVANEIACGFMGETTVAATAITPRAGEEYMKIVCQRRNQVAAQD